tara:strand:- start:205 stop:645 length:441 start_codon:yes stop_codon:yes gene_type:complete
MLLRNDWGELYSTYNKESIMNNPDIEPPILQVSQSLGQYYACLLECDNLGNYVESNNRGILHNFKREAIKDMMNWAKLDNLSYYNDRGLQLRAEDYKKLFNQFNNDIDDDEYPCDKEFDKIEYINDQLYSALGTFHIINNTSVNKE